MEEKPFYVYVLKNPDGRLYIGFTADIEERIRRHQDGEAGWTKNRGPWELVHCETFTNLADAMRREKNLKRGRTNQELRKHLLSSSTVEQSFQHWKDAASLPNEGPPWCNPLS